MFLIGKFCFCFPPVRKDNRLRRAALLRLFFARAPNEICQVRIITSASQAGRGSLRKLFPHANLRWEPAHTSHHAPIRSVSEPLAIPTTLSLIPEPITVVGGTNLGIVRRV